jgi:hypothetical protein
VYERNVTRLAVAYTEEPPLTKKRKKERKKNIWAAHARCWRMKTPRSRYYLHFIWLFYFFFSGFSEPVAKRRLQLRCGSCMLLQCWSDCFDLDPEKWFISFLVISLALVYNWSDSLRQRRRHPAAEGAHSLPVDVIETTNTLWWW